MPLALHFPSVYYDFFIPYIWRFGARGNLAKVSHLPQGYLFQWGYKPAWKVMQMELCCVLITDATPTRMSVRCVYSWELSVTSADTPATISSSCKLSYFTLAMAQSSRAKPLLFQSIWACKYIHAAQTNAVLQNQMQVHVWVEKQVNLAHVMLCTVLVPEQVHLRQARNPDLTLLSIRTLCRIKALENERHQGSGSHIVEVCAL